MKHPDPFSHHPDPRGEGAAWRRQAGANRSGGNAEIIVGGGRVLLARLEGRDRSADEPRACSVSVSADWPTDGAALGRLDVVGVVRWAQGAGFSEAEFDVPAGGVQLSVAGGADSIDVMAYAMGTSTERIAVNAQIGLSSTPHIAPKRTLLHTLPADAAVILRIPRFSSRLSILVDDPTVVGVGACAVSFLGENGLGLRELGACYYAGGVGFDVPLGARYFRLVTPLLVPIVNLYTVWELAL